VLTAADAGAFRENAVGFNKKHQQKTDCGAARCAEPAVKKRRMFLER
jgi:hypothetical protein